MKANIRSKKTFSLNYKRELKMCCLFDSVTKRTKICKPIAGRVRQHKILCSYIVLCSAGEMSFACKYDFYTKY